MSRHGKRTIFMMDLWATVPYYTAYLTRALLAVGADVMVGSITYYLDPGCFRSRGIRLEPGLLDVIGQFSPPPRWRRPLKLIEALLNLTALTVRFLFRPPVVVHVQYLALLRWKIMVECWFLHFCRFRGARIVLTVHDLLPHDTADRHKHTFVSLYASVDLLICHSESIRSRLCTEFPISASKVVVIPHGPFFYDLSAMGQEHTLQSFELEQNKVLVLWQGIIFPYKGVDLLLRAWQEVETEGDAYLMIVGTGAPELLQQIQKQVKDLNLKRVKLHLRFVSSEELVALYRVADVVVYPYSAITTSGALATGLALGKAIVATDLPVFREVLTNRQNALLVTPQDAHELAKALLELTRNTALRMRFAENIRGMNFGDQSWLSIAKKTIEAYESILGRTDNNPRA